MSAPDRPPGGYRPAGGLRLLYAFVELRWRVLVNGISARRRGVWRRLGAAAEVLSRVFVGLGAAGLALVGAVLGGFLPGALVRLNAESTPLGFSRAERLLLVVRIALALLLFVVLMVPAVQGLAGGGLPRTRLLLLPVRRRTLHALELGAHLGDPWLLAIVPALAAVGIASLVVAGTGGLVVLAAGLLFVLAVAALSASVTFGVALLLRDRRRAEALALLLFVLWMAVAVTPGWLESRREEPPVSGPLPGPVAEETAGDAPAPPSPPGAREAEGETGRGGARHALLDPPAIALLLPSEAYARAVGLAVLGRPAAALAPTGILAGVTLVLFALSRLVWNRLLASPPVAAGRRGAAEPPRPYRLPALSAPASAVAWGQLRSLSRTLAGRLALLSAPAATVVIVTMFRGELAELAIGGRTLGTTGGAVALGAGIVGLSLLSIQNFLINQFALDGPGFDLSALSPISPRDHVAGKWAAGAIAALGLVLVTTGLVMALAPGALPFWPALLLGGLGVYALLAPAGALLSILLPKRVDLGRLGRDSQPNQAAVLLGMLALPLALAPPLLAGAAAYLVTRSALVVTAVETLWLLAAGGLARLLLGPVARLLAARREEIHLAVHD